MTDGRARVAVDGRALSESSGGLHRFASCLVPELPRAAPDIDWDLLVLDPAVAPADWNSVTRIPGSLNAAFRGWWEDHRLPGSLRRHDSHALLSLYGAVPRTPVPVVAVVHDLVALDAPHTLPFRHRRYWRRVARRLPGARAIVCNSQATAARVRRLNGIASIRVIAAPLAPAPIFARSDEHLVRQVIADFSLQQPYILAVGASGPRKGLSTLMAAADNAGVTVVVTGRGPVPDSARHVGVVSDARLATLMSGALAVACPSILEGFGLPVVEAMACGAPVLASDTPALAEAAGNAARLVPIGNVAAWTTAISEIALNPALRQSMIDAGRRRVTNLSWQRVANAVADTVRTVLASP